VEIKGKDNDALQRLRNNGSLVLVMHKLETLNVISIVQAFIKFPNVRLFKPKKTHVVRSPFYIVVTEVNMQSEQAQLAILEWKLSGKMRHSILTALDKLIPAYLRIRHAEYWHSSNQNLLFLNPS
jgi:hypothetical protein